MRDTQRNGTVNGVQIQRRRPFSSLLLGAVGKRAANKFAPPRQIAPDGRLATPSSAADDVTDTFSDLDAGSQIEHRDGDSILPCQTPPATESLSSEPSVARHSPLSRCQFSQPVQELLNATEADSATAFLASGSKCTGMVPPSLESDSYRNTSHSREQSPDPVQNSSLEPRSDDDAATVTGCCLLDLWSQAAATSEPKQASSSTLTAPKREVAVKTEVIALTSEHAGPVQLKNAQAKNALRLCPVQLAAQSSTKRPRVSITLGSMPARPSAKQHACSGVSSEHTRRRAAVASLLPACGMGASELCGSPALAPVAPPPPQVTTSQQSLNADLTTWQAPSSSADMTYRAAAHEPPAETSPAGPAPSAVATASTTGPPDDLPMSVRLDRDIINTMLVTRRTSSRWSEYARDGAPWTLEEEAWLMRHYQEGGTLAWLSEQLSRTRSAVKARLKRRGSCQSRVLRQVGIKTCRLRPHNGAQFSRILPEFGKHAYLSRLPCGS